MEPDGKSSLSSSSSSKEKSSKSSAGCSLLSAVIFIGVTAALMYGAIMLKNYADTKNQKESIGFLHLCDRLKARSLKAIARAGLSQHPLGSDLGAIPMPAQHLHNAGCRDIQQQPHLLDYSAGTPAHEALYENFRVSMVLAQPFYKKMLQVSQEELDADYNAVLLEMMQPDFRALWYFVTTWGIVQA